MKSVKWKRIKGKEAKMFISGERKRKNLKAGHVWDALYPECWEEKDTGNQPQWKTHTRSCAHTCECTQNKEAKPSPRGEEDRKGCYKWASLPWSSIKEPPPNCITSPLSTAPGPRNPEHMSQLPRSLVSSDPVLDGLHLYSHHYTHSFMYSM